MTFSAGAVISSALRLIAVPIKGRAGWPRFPYSFTNAISAFRVVVLPRFRLPLKLMFS